MSGRTCPECHGNMAPRMSGFWACTACGKLMVKPADDLPVAREAGEHLQPSDSPVIPDFHEVMVGWRAWGLDPNLAPGAAPVLRSVTFGKKAKLPFWTPREAMEATCEKRRSCHTPGEGCSCGLYAAKSRQHLMSMKYHRYDAERNGLFHVIGSVALWGKVIEGSQGWRAQIGYPRELFLPYEAHHLAAPLAETYGVPVRLQNILKTEVS